MVIRWGFAALAIGIAAACSQEAGTQTATIAPTEAIIDGNLRPFLGKEDAEVVLIEYGAPTCPGCGAWHANFWQPLKAAYIDTNLIRFEFRVLPSHNPPVDAAIAGIGLCAGPDRFYDVLDKAFEDQLPIEMATRQGEARQAMVDLGDTFDLSEEQTMTCVNDPGRIDYIAAIQTEAQAVGVLGTPTFVIDGEIIEDSRFPALSEAIDAALAAAGEGEPGAEADADPS